MPAFKFKMAQRVSYPASPEVQAIVVGQTHHIDGTNSYAIRCLKDDGEPAIAFLGEATIADAQPNPVDPVDQVKVVAKETPKLPTNEFRPQRSAKAKIKRSRK